MALASAVKYTVRLHVDTNSVDAGFNKNIIFDGIEVESWNDSAYVGATAVTAIKVGNDPGTDLDSFFVQTSYPAAYAGTDPGTLRVKDHIIAAFNAIQAIVNATPFVGFPGGGPVPVILTLGSLVGGTGYPTLTNFVAKLTGGSGYGAVAKITSSGGAVTSVTLVTPGYGYVAGDVLSANLGVLGNTYPAVPGTGFTITAATVGSPLTNTLYA
jgi:hypothetical protein